MPALIFDCDGVLADTERDGHRPAFNETFAEIGLPVNWSEAEYAEKLRIGGGKERMASLLTDEFVRANGLPTDPEGQKDAARRLAQAQDRALQGDGRSPAGCPPAPASRGSSTEALGAGWTLAVASTSAEESVRAVLEHAVGTDNAAQLRGVRRRHRAGQEARSGDLHARARAARDPEPRDAIVIEDSRNGLLAAVGAGLRCVVTVSGYTARGGHERGGARRLEPRRSRRAGRACWPIAAPREPGELVTLADLDACRTQPLLDKETV